MKIREFNKLLKIITTKKLLDVDKIYLLSNKQRSDMVYFIIRNRQAVVKELIPEGFDWNWLASMGYMYQTTKNGFDFICNGENKMRLG